eukprot:CAMPEP_0176461532 /NCGR_PEP_ID=MMETSP0127-20121128/34719_1 /TAXON_ID=938130 /ORGANISM="Platyophrya macrostoma, Strain WH" /LENGTH=184 /DNA_ID=CAMNT_0017853259 /DNA_START=20 /DNA_END=574 /DNA_ORIENTATION=+
MADTSKKVRVYTDGCYDLFHYGHAQQLEQCKKLFPNVHLIVGVAGDADTIKFKGTPVMNEHMRATSIKHCKWADEVICPCPWVITPEFLEQHKIDYVAHDDEPYVSAGSTDIYADVKKLGKFRATQRTDGISTSDIIYTITYILRNLKKGFTRQQLGVSWLELQWIKLTEGCKRRSAAKKTKKD